MMRLIMFILLWTLSCASFAEANNDLFLQAKKAFARGDTGQFFLLKDSLLDHPLHPYLDYYYINRHFKTIDDKVIQAFINSHPDSPMAKKLRKKWMNEFSDNKQWSQFLAVYQPTTNTDIKCDYLTALVKTGQKGKAFAELMPLWLTEKSQPDSCDPLFNVWLNGADNKDDLVWQRFSIALSNKKVDLAKSLLPRLSPGKKAEAKQVLRVYHNPHLVKKKSFRTKKTTAEVISFGLGRLARISPRDAINQWRKLRHQYKFTPEQEQRIFQAVGLRMALSKNSNSTKWFRKVIGADLLPVYKDWMIRAAIVHGDWQLVTDSIDGLSKEEQAMLRWQYWYGRALDKLGEKERAKKILTRVAAERNYYGFLASYYLEQPINVKHESLAITEEEINAVRNQPGYRRAVELLKLNYKHDARVELFTMMKYLPEKQQYILTKLISEWGWHPQALRMSHHAEHKDDIQIRFPLPFHETINQHAKKYAVDPALIYAIMRQESYFMPQANSHAGAVGLMQLIPSTASKTARQYALSYKGKKDLLNHKANIQLGSAHLKQLKLELNAHPALVIAAYNAGKNAVTRWIPKKSSLPTDIWIETVPYYETRNYLRNVIACYIVYQHRLGQTPNLAKVMRPVGG